MPTSRHPSRKSPKLRWKIATMPMSAPAPPASAQVTKPTRRPTRRISSEMGNVVSAVPTMVIDMGSVAQEGLGASCAPTRPEVTTTAVRVAP